MPSHAPAPVVEIVHVVPGRVRLRVPLLARYPALAERLATAGPMRPGLRAIRLNAACASVIVEVDSAALAQHAVRALVVEWLAEQAHQSAHGPLPAVQAEHQRGQDGVGSSLPALGAGLVGLGLTFLGGGLPQSLALAVTALGTVPTLLRAGRALLVERRPSAEQLDVSATAMMFLIGDVRGAALSRVIAALAEGIRDLTARRSQRIPVDLRGTLGTWAWLLRDGQEVTVAVEELAVDDVVVVYPGGPIPVDGVVEGGVARVNQRALTGEGRPVDKVAGDSVYAATLVTQGWLHVRARAVGADTRAGWIVHTLEQLPERDTRAADYASHFVDRQVVPAFGLAGLTWATTRNAERTAAVLNVDYGTGIELSAPTSILATMAHAAQDGILIKSGGALERLAAADAIVLDKTGTLTHGRPEVTQVLSLVDGTSADHLLALAAGAEGSLRHVVARAIVRHARRQGLPRLTAETFEHVPRLGVSARVDGHQVHVGNVRFLGELGLDRDPITLAHATELGLAGNAVVYVVIDGRLCGLLAYQDLPRREARKVVQWLRDHGVSTVHMVTGDAPFGTFPTALTAGIAEADVHHDALPEDKAAVVQELQRAGHVVAFVGDGIDDAPALAMADVAVSFGHGMSAAQDTADVVLLDRDLERLVHAIELSRASLGIIRQNLTLVRLTDALTVALAMAGRLDAAGSALVSAAGTAIAEANSLRPLLVPRRVGKHHHAPHRRDASHSPAPGQPVAGEPGLFLLAGR